jgi:hypothetical protein
MWQIRNKRYECGVEMFGKIFEGVGWILCALVCSILIIIFIVGIVNDVKRESIVRAANAAIERQNRVDNLACVWSKKNNACFCEYEISQHAYLFTWVPPEVCGK